MKKNEIIETAKTVGESVVRAGFGAVPFVGTALNEIFFDCRSRIVQNRINSFIEKLIEYFSSLNDNNIDYDHIKSEDFYDVFYCIVESVTRTKSEAKISVFKDILVNQLKKENMTDFSTTFLDIILKIDEKEIEIINYYYALGKGSIKSSVHLPNIQNGIHNYFKLTEELFNSYKIDLAAKGLLKDAGKTGAPITPYLSTVEISPFGNRFIEFIGGLY